MVHVVAHVVALAENALVEHVVLRLDDLLQPRVVLLEVDDSAARRLDTADGLVRRLRAGAGGRAGASGRAGTGGRAQEGGDRAASAEGVRGSAARWVAAGAAGTAVLAIESESSCCRMVLREAGWGWEARGGNSGGRRDKNL